VIRVGEAYRRGDYTWTLMRENGGYILTRMRNGKLDKRGESHTRRGTLKEMRREFMRQQMCLDSPWFAGFDKVV